MTILLITSLFAAALAFHNNISRYLFSISRDGLIWKKLCQTHPTNGTPHNASHLHSVILLLLLAGLGSAGLDPVTHIFATGSAVATLCILILQLGVSAAVIVFFRSRPGSCLLVFWAPLASIFCMGATIILVVNNLQSLSGNQSEAVKLIPWLIAACALPGYGLSLRRGVRVKACDR